MWIRSEALGQETLTWAVAGSGTWDTATANWSGGSTTYEDGDIVNFENPSGGEVTIQSGGVNPGPVNVSVANTTGTYTFTGGPIGGSGPLTKSGSGSLVLDAALGTSSQSTDIAVQAGGSLTLAGGNEDYVTMPTTSGSFAGNLNLDAGVTLNIESSADFSHPVLINGKGKVNFVGSGATLFVGDANGGGSGAAEIDNNIVMNSGSTAGFLTSFGASDSNQLTIDGTLSGDSDVYFITANHFNAPTIILSASNTYTGATYLNFAHGSVLQLGTNNALPTSTQLIFGASSGAAGALDLNGFNQTVTELSVATASGEGNINGITNTGIATSTLTVNQSIDSTYGSDIGTLGNNLTGPNVNNINLVKQGPGELRLLGNCTYTGSTSVQGGTLIVNGGASGSDGAGITQTSGVTVSNGATLAGRGFIGVAPGGQVVIGPGATISPGDEYPGSDDYPTGELSISDTSTTPSSAGTFDLENNATLYISLGAQTSGGSQVGANSGPGFDSQVAVQGNITLNGNLEGTLLSGFTANLGDLFFIILNDGTNAINGTFTGLPQSSLITLAGPGGTQNFEIGYTGDAAENTFTGGNDVVLEMVVPEPGGGEICLAGLGMLGICGVYRRYGCRRNRP